ncbi:hypothetical protein QF031_001293 [Pseudarthrobacter defluvii]|uniref:hypothetical protein n=1 Tax=Pseudarthrobacter defluvii TaxID=410837 RepID=UPI00277D5FC3|nr:hypothetical protein [Pseudarthrobacter defluvii]MDQ0768544.1 hypothetical protein [Pseudarthrobacter defluvii]
MSGPSTAGTSPRGPADVLEGTTGATPQRRFHAGKLVGRLRQHRGLTAAGAQWWWLPWLS